MKQPFLFTWKNRSLDRTFISVKLKQTPYLQTKKFHTKKGDTESQFIVLRHEKLGFNFKIKLSFENSSHYYFIPPHLTLALTASSLGQNGKITVLMRKLEEKSRNCLMSANNHVKTQLQNHILLTIITTTSHNLIDFLR